MLVAGPGPGFPQVQAHLVDLVELAEMILVEEGYQVVEGGLPGGGGAPGVTATLFLVEVAVLLL
jgi:hypothetical protein